MSQPQIPMAYPGPGQEIALVVGLVFMSDVFVLLRIIARLKTKVAFGLDDYLIYACAILNFPYLAVNIWGRYGGERGNKRTLIIYQGISRETTGLLIWRRSHSKISFSTSRLYCLLRLSLFWRLIEFPGSHHFCSLLCDNHHPRKIQRPVLLPPHLWQAHLSRNNNHLGPAKHLVDRMLLSRGLPMQAGCWKLEPHLGRIMR